MSHLIDESKDDIVAKSCKEVPIVQAIWKWHFPQQHLTDHEKFLAFLYHYLCQISFKS